MIKRLALLVLTLASLLVGACAPIEQTSVPSSGSGTSWVGAPGGGTVPLATGALAAYPTSYITPSSTVGVPGMSYGGWHAQVINYLLAEFPGIATSYETHNDVGGGVSADLWTNEATKHAHADNRGVASMQALAAFISTHRQALGIRYMVWAGHRYSAAGVEALPDQGNHNDNHNSHPHITFEDGAPIVAQGRTG